MLKGRENAVLLRHLAVQIEEAVLPTLDKTSWKTPCGIERYKCWPDHLMHDQLRSIRDKLRRLAEMFEKNRSFNEPAPPCPTCAAPRDWSAQNRVVCHACHVEEKIGPEPEMPL